MAKLFENSITKWRNPGSNYLWLSMIIVLAISACQADSPVVPKHHSTNVKLFSMSNSRAEWRNLLGWNEDCEQSFSSTQAGDYSGIETHALGNADELVIVMCAVGSYQPSFLLYLLKGSASKALALETYTATDGQNLLHSYDKELWGEPVILDESKELVILNVARQTADCGTWAKYSLTSDAVRLQDFRFKLPCPEATSEAVNSSSGRPPKGWQRLKK